MTTGELAAVLGAKQINRWQWRAKCPSCCEGRRLLLTTGRDGRIILECTRCTVGEVLKALSLVEADLYSECYRVRKLEAFDADPIGGMRRVCTRK